MSAPEAPELLTREYLRSAATQDTSLSVEETSNTGMLLWDNEEAKFIPVHFLEEMNAEALAKRIYVSKNIPERYSINKRALAEYLWDFCDKNAFITMDELVVIWSEPEDPETFEPSDFVDSELSRLYDRFGDEYAFEISACLLGQLWFERNIAVVNMGEIVRAARSIAEENSDICACDPYFSFENQVEVGFLTTIIHELRHLQMDTNIFLPEDIYPLTLGSERAVEQYCREAYEASVVPPDVFPHLYGHQQSLAYAISTAKAVATSLGCKKTDDPARGR